jgi:predicted HTH domain antitoxin
MQTKTIEVAVPADLLELLKESRFGERSVEDQFRIAMAIHFLQQGIISTGKAASIAAVPRAEFELTLGEAGIPYVTYTLGDYLEERKTWLKAKGTPKAQIE